MSNMRYIPVSKVWALESWGVELGGLISALSITVDAITDFPDSDTAENKEDYKNQLRMMMEDAPDEQTRQSIKRMLDTM